MDDRLEGFKIPITKFTFITFLRFTVFFIWKKRFSGRLASGQNIISLLKIMALKLAIALHLTIICVLKIMVFRICLFKIAKSFYRFIHRFNLAQVFMYLLNEQFYFFFSTSYYLILLLRFVSFLSTFIIYFANCYPNYCLHFDSEAYIIEEP